ncbi:hypothetical protein GNI_109720 [Gregarina niphandrodes]|uniref:Uncharacterized protein n=1 Tax=Gregarina niphandrodes TaxID=110365 RepID=A0A023B3Y9_GRENI|nr:hypothetical protein GNI_109720 [Gregarina niphandrodes]EZG55694.1 hypothetical protein GNI_109720 [Gregarina niphandrodes]|eukprot:XP_011131465.1 hypothetical protein GNI_109720 [Gregarina niphandrodes]
MRVLTSGRSGQRVRACVVVLAVGDGIRTPEHGAVAEERAGEERVDARIEDERVEAGRVAGVQAAGAGAMGERLGPGGSTPHRIWHLLGPNAVERAQKQALVLERCSGPWLELAAVTDGFGRWPLGRLSEAEESRLRRLLWVADDPERRLAVFATGCQLSSFSNWRKALVVFCVSTLLYCPPANSFEAFCDATNAADVEHTRVRGPDSQRMEGLVRSLAALDTLTAAAYARRTNLRPVGGFFTEFASFYNVFEGSEEMASEALRTLFTEDERSKLRNVNPAHLELCDRRYIELGAVISLFFNQPFGTLSDRLQATLDSEVRSLAHPWGGRAAGVIDGRRYPLEHFADLWVTGCLLQRSGIDLEKLKTFVELALPYRFRARQGPLYARTTRVRPRVYNQARTTMISINEYLSQDHFQAPPLSLRTFMEHIRDGVRSLTGVKTFVGVKTPAKVRRVKTTTEGKKEVGHNQPSTLVAPEELTAQKLTATAQFMGMETESMEPDDELLEKVPESGCGSSKGTEAEVESGDAEMESGDAEMESGDAEMECNEPMSVVARYLAARGPGDDWMANLPREREELVTVLDWLCVSPERGLNVAHREVLYVLGWLLRVPAGWMVSDDKLTACLNTLCTQSNPTQSLLFHDPKSEVRTPRTPGRAVRRQLQVAAKLFADLGVEPVQLLAFALASWNWSDLLRAFPAGLLPADPHPDSLLHALRTTRLLPSC